MELETIGKIIATGFGDRAFMGIIMGFLDGVSPEKVYAYIRDDVELAYWVSEGGWGKYRDMAKTAKVNITIEDIIEGLRKHRSDLLGVIINDPNGMEWLRKQADMLKGKLGLN